MRSNEKVLFIFSTWRIDTGFGKGRNRECEWSRNRWTSWTLTHTIEDLRIKVANEYRYSSLPHSQLDDQDSLVQRLADDF